MAEDQLNALMMGNLAALNRVQPTLVERLCRPSVDDHIAGTPVHLTLNRTRYPLATNPEALHRCCPTGETGTLLVFGVGTGDVLNAVLRGNPDATVIAWDRDPAMMRLALGNHDFSQRIRMGTLKWALGEDIVDHRSYDLVRVVDHPLLRHVYAAERHLLMSAPDTPCALMCSGGLFVDDVTAHLQNSGMAVYTWDIQRQPPKSLGETAQRIRPEFAFAINYFPGISEACADLEIPLIVWEIDPATDGLAPVGGNTDHVHIHTYRASNVARFEAAGFRHVAYTPLAANTRKRTPCPDGGRMGPEVCFVGASMVGQATEFRSLFLDAWVAAHPGDTDARSHGLTLLNGLLTQQRMQPRTYLIPELMMRHMADFVAAVEGHLPHDPVALVGEIAAAERRLTVAARLGGEGLHVWGDPGWKAAERHGVVHRGFAGHHQQLTTIYQQGKIHVDINRLYQLDIVPMRVFDVLACGGFLIAEHSPALSALFTIGEELESWSSIDELIEKVRFYKKHPDAARRIAERGRIAVVERHSMADRVSAMLADRPSFSPAIEVG